MSHEQLLGIIQDKKGFLMGIFRTAVQKDCLKRGMLKILNIRFETSNPNVIAHALESSPKFSELAKFIKGEYWAEEMSRDQTFKLGNALVELYLDMDVNSVLEYEDTHEDVKKLEFFEGGNPNENFCFEVDDLRKKLFLFVNSIQWNTLNTLTKAINALAYIEETELEMEKSVLNFDNEEVIQAIVNLYQGRGLSLRSTVQAVSIASRYSSSFDGGSKKSWRYNQSLASISKLMGSDQTISDSLVEEYIHSYFKEDANPQYSIVPLLIFEGVKLSTIDEEDELRYIREEDIYENGIFLKSGNPNSEGRFIELDKDVVRMVQEALHQEFYFGVMKRAQNPRFRNTGYLIKPVELSDVFSNLSYHGVSKRYREFQNYLEEKTGEKVTARTLTDYGKVRAVNQFSELGNDERTSIVKSLQRFGEFDYYLAGGIYNRKNIDETNETRIFRLKNLRKVYGGNQED